jgi:DNA-binding GntR family transcriptional regulator
VARLRQYAVKVTLDPNDARPPYQQVADELRREIQAGEYPPGKQLPSISELAERFAVAKNTVQAALRLLRDAGLVVARQGKGVYVRTDAPVDEASPDLMTVTQQIDALSENMQQLADRVTALEASVRGRELRQRPTPQRER